VVGVPDEQAATSLPSDSHDREEDTNCCSGRKREPEEEGKEDAGQGLPHTPHPTTSTPDSPVNSHSQSQALGRLGAVLERIY